jgi:hypothetical protein
MNFRDFKVSRVTVSQGKNRCVFIAKARIVGENSDTATAIRSFYKRLGFVKERFQQKVPVAFLKPIDIESGGLTGMSGYTIYNQKDMIVQFNMRKSSRHVVQFFKGVLADKIELLPDEEAEKLLMLSEV